MRLHHITTRFRHVFVFALKAEWSFIKREYALDKIETGGHGGPPLQYQFVKFPDATVLQVGPGRETSCKNFLEFISTHECENVWHLGTCGALVPELHVGDIFVATKITGGHTGPPLHQNMIPVGADPCVRPLRHVTGTLFTSATVLKNKSEKEIIAKTYGAKIVDMESAGIAKICAEKNIRYTSIRAVFDTLDDDLENIGEPYTSTGNLAAGKLIYNIIKSPQLIMTLPLLQKRMAVVQKKLSEVVKRILDEFP